MSTDIPTSLHLQVITSHRVLTDDEVLEVILPSLDGYLGIFPGHRPLLVVLGEGELTLRTQDKQESFPVEGGYAEVQPGKILVFTELQQDESDGSNQR